MQRSPIRCRMSPICLVSNNDIVRRINLTRKSLTSDMFTRILICSNNQRRMKSTTVLLNVSIKRIISAIMMADHLQTSNATLHSIMLPIKLEI